MTFGACRPARRRRALAPPIVLAALAIGGCDSGSRAAPPAAGLPGGPPPRAVTLVPAIQAMLDRTVTVSGTLAADDQAVLSFKVPGRVLEIGVDLGSRVRHGETIARLDPTDYRLRVAQAEAGVQQARARLGLREGDPDDAVDPDATALVQQARATREEARLTRDRAAALLAKQLVPQSDLDAAEAALAVADARLQDAFEEVRTRQAILAERRSQVDLARQQLADSVLLAPIDGAVRVRQASPGEYVLAGSPIVTLVRVHPLRLRLPVPERESHEVRVGQSVRVRVEGDPASHEGRIARLSPSIAAENRTLLVEADVPNPEGRLRPGSFARADIFVQPRVPAVLVPSSALVGFAGIEKVMTVRDGRVVERRVVTGRRDGDRVEIVEGLDAGEPVVVDPGNLVGGQPVVATP
jgi:RND family efflux transporter MFP subunit